MIEQIHLYINEIITVKLCAKENSCRSETGIVLNKTNQLSERPQFYNRCTFTMFTMNLS